MTHPQGNGFFITFEGIDACGKSTQIKLLYDYLRKNHIDAICIRDPGSTPISESIRSILLDDNNSAMSSWTELLLYEAARAQMVQEVIHPALAAGTLILCDRFYDSTTAYQGYGRGLDLHLVHQANAIGSVQLVPDMTFFIDVDPQIAAERKRQSGDQADRLEAEGLAFQEKVRHGFCEIQQKNPDRVRRINGRQKIKEIQKNILDIMRKCKIID